MLSPVIWYKTSINSYVDPIIVFPDYGLWNCYLINNAGESATEMGFETDNLVLSQNRERW